MFLNSEGDTVCIEYFKNSQQSYTFSAIKTYLETNDRFYTTEIHFHPKKNNSWNYIKPNSNGLTFILQKKSFPTNKFETYLFSLVFPVFFFQFKMSP